MIKVGLIFGWISNEAWVSAGSAQNIIKNFDKTKYELIQIYRSKDNKFFHISNITEIKSLNMKQEILPKNFKNIFDIALPITHWKYWEDWVIQSILEIQQIPYTWSRVLSSSLCMNKAILKRFLKQQDINQVKFETIDYSLEDKTQITQKIKNIPDKFQLPVYIKPANSWSSIWITKLTNRDYLNQAIKEAKNHDTLVLIEEWLIKPQEVEVAIIWNWELITSTPGELVKDYDFYSFDEKYINNKMNITIPALIEDSLLEKIKILSEKIYKLCDCRWFSRIDFFVSNKKVYFNEINTIPGFTEISAFPILMKHTGMTYTEIINKIIELAY